jgi:hypothetical protein
LGRRPIAGVVSRLAAAGLPGTTTMQPAFSSSLTVAKLIVGRMMSTRQVTNKPARGFGLKGRAALADGSFMSIPWSGRISRPCRNLRASIRSHNGHGHRNPRL